jgi:hypothetical protein
MNSSRTRPAHIALYPIRGLLAIIAAQALIVVIGAGGAASALAQESAGGYSYGQSGPYGGSGTASMSIPAGRSGTGFVGKRGGGSTGFGGSRGMGSMAGIRGEVSFGSGGSDNGSRNHFGSGANADGAGQAGDYGDLNRGDMSAALKPGTKRAIGKSAMEAGKSSDTGLPSVSSECDQPAWNSPRSWQADSIYTARRTLPPSDYQWGATAK